MESHGFGIKHFVSIFDSQRRRRRRRDKKFVFPPIFLPLFLFYVAHSSLRKFKLTGINIAASNEMDGLRSRWSSVATLPHAALISRVDGGFSWVSFQDGGRFQGRMDTIKSRTGIWRDLDGSGWIWRRRNGRPFRHPANMITRSDLRWARTVETISTVQKQQKKWKDNFFLLLLLKKKIKYSFRKKINCNNI